MKTFKIYGCSDDLIEIEGAIREEFCALNKPCVMKIASGADSLHIVAQYAFKNVAGTWMIGVMPADDAEDHPMPDWKISIGRCPEVPYSAMLTIETPNDAILTRVQFAGEKEE